MVLRLEPFVEWSLSKWIYQSLYFVISLLFHHMNYRSFCGILLKFFLFLFLSFKIPSLFIFEFFHSLHHHQNYDQNLLTCLAFFSCKDFVAASGGSYILGFFDPIYKNNLFFLPKLNTICTIYIYIYIYIYYTYGLFLLIWTYFNDVNGGRNILINSQQLN